MLHLCSLRREWRTTGALRVSSFESEQGMEELGGAGASPAAETRCVPHQGPLSLAEKSAQEWADEEIGLLSLLWDDGAGDTRWVEGHPWVPVGHLWAAGEYMEV
jgi:hypothetical protein